MFYPKLRLAVSANALYLTVAMCLTGCASTAAKTEDSTKSSQATNDKTGTAYTGIQKIENPRFLGIFSPYHPDIQQGNFISQEMMAQLKEGMTRDQVRFLLGTPLLTDMFHADRWDYVFRLHKGNGEILTSRITILFKEDRVAHLEGGNLPSEKDYLNLIVGDSNSASKK